MSRFSKILLFLFSGMALWGQEIDLSYYLPSIDFDENIPTPKSFLGHEVGEWHVSHDKLYFYAKELAENSDRLEMFEYARSHENRPLVYLVATSPENHERLEDIRLQHKQLTDTRVSQSVNTEELPIVIYQGCSIHGNEPSGANAALAVMYYLAAGQGAEIEQLLDEAIILFDPSFNPDGLHRFSTWVNTHKGKESISDPVNREFNEVWPGGRTNHYWFDLNRDWLLLTHPESRGRIATFHHWKPDILTDHHEMGSNSTFFFQPGIPSRTNPNTPSLNQELTGKIGEFHGRALDRIGSLYYTKESYDDFYYGKGSTYPDAQGCIGILFEQASSRGHLRQTDYGLLSFPFTIRNQVTTMLSTQEAGLALRKEILEYKRQSFLEARKLASENPVKAYVFGDKEDPIRTGRFVEILLSHQIEVHQLNRDVKSDDYQFSKDEDFLVRLDQDQYRLAKSIFERVTNFEDSLFYDVSAWTMPLAFNIPHVELRESVSPYMGDLIEKAPGFDGRVIGPEKPYAYLIDWDQFNAPKFLHKLKQEGLIVTLANESFVSFVGDQETVFERGTLIVPTGNNQKVAPDQLHSLMNDLAVKHKVEVIGVSTGMVASGVNLGSRSTSAIEEVRPLMIIGNGVSSYDAGELWHHFDHVLGMSVTMVETSAFSRVRLSDYNLIIMPNGSYGSMNGQADKLKGWLQSGGNIVAIRGAIRWLKNREIIELEVFSEDKEEEEEEEPIRGVFANEDEDRGALVTGGMIALAEIDLTHPLFYGYDREELAFFHRGNDFYRPVTNVYRTPAIYSSVPVLSGYLHPKNEEQMKGAAAVFTSRVGRGNVIGLVDNPVFRGYWWGTAKLLANAMFFGGNL